MTVDVTPFAAPRGPTPGRLYVGCRAEAPAAPLASPPERVPWGGGCVAAGVTPFAAPGGPSPGRLYVGCGAAGPAAPLASPPERVPAGGGAPPPPARATASCSSSGDSRASPATLRPFSATYGV